MSNIQPEPHAPARTAANSGMLPRMAGFSWLWRWGLIALLVVAATATGTTTTCEPHC